ncbi:MAG: hypothetical protein ACKVQW_12710 [Pyrinomonadaceae bacterium]
MNSLSKDSPPMFKFCGEDGLNSYLGNLKLGLSSEVSDADPDYISHVDESEYSKYLTKKYSIDCPNLYFDQPSIWETRRLIPAEWFPPNQFMIEKGEKYEREVVIYRIPFEGNQELFKFKPDENVITYGSDIIETYIESQHLCFERINFYGDLQKMKGRINSGVGLIQEKYSKLIQRVSEFNWGVEWHANEAIKQRKSRLNSLTEILGVPVKKLSSIPEVFSSNTVEKQILIKPALDEKKQNSEYVLSDEIYSDILQKLYDIGKNFERYPSTHTGKREEDLRDMIITFLQPLYKLSVTAETFNKQGKTDILMRFENTNVFIAECKFWNGKKEFLEGISQLLSYLTWRDSKAAVIVFVKRKDFSAILLTAKTSIREHSNYVNYVDEHEDAWLNFVFHLNGDKQKEVKLSLLLFHLDEPG